MAKCHSVLPRHASGIKAKHNGINAILQSTTAEIQSVEVQNACGQPAYLAPAC